MLRSARWLPFSLSSMDVSSPDALPQVFRTGETQGKPRYHTCLTQAALELTNLTQRLPMKGKGPSQKSSRPSGRRSRRSRGQRARRSAPSGPALAATFHNHHVVKSLSEPMAPPTISFKALSRLDSAAGSESNMFDSGLLWVFDPSPSALAALWYWVTAGGSSGSALSTSTAWNAAATSPHILDYSRAARTTAASLRLSFTGSTLADSGRVYIARGLNPNGATIAGDLSDAIRTGSRTQVFPLRALRSPLIINSHVTCRPSAQMYKAMSNFAGDTPEWIESTDADPMPLSGATCWEKIYVLVEGMAASGSTLSGESIVHYEALPLLEHQALATPVRCTGGHAVPGTHTFFESAAQSLLGGASEGLKAIGRQAGAALTYTVGRRAVGSALALMG